MPQLSQRRRDTERVALPQPKYDSRTSIERVLLKRRSVRDYSHQAITLAQLSQLLWAGQGVTDPAGFRTAPSAGALYPLELNVLAGSVTNLAPGLYKYLPTRHILTSRDSTDKRYELAQAAFAQPFIAEAPAVLVIGAVFGRTAVKYASRASRYVYMEAGHSAQNIYLQCVSLRLGTVVIGAFQDDRVKKALRFSAEEDPLYLMPVGQL